MEERVREGEMRTTHTVEPRPEMERAHEERGGQHGHCTSVKSREIGQMNSNVVESALS